MNSGIRKFDMSKLNKFVRGLEAKGSVRVGLFGDKANRKKKGPATNPDLGVVHEFGRPDKGIPARSFLRMPLHQKGAQIVKSASRGIKSLLAAGDKKGILNNLGRAAVEAVDLAFRTGGFGTWPKDKPATIRRKHSSKPLIDTGQLRRSVAWQVVGK